MLQPKTLCCPGVLVFFALFTYIDRPPGTNTLFLPAELVLLPEFPRESCVSTFFPCPFP